MYEVECNHDDNDEDGYRESSSRREHPALLPQLDCSAQNFRGFKCRRGSRQTSSSVPDTYRTRSIVAPPWLWSNRSHTIYEVDA